MTLLIEKIKMLRDRKYLDALREMRCILTEKKGHPDVETVDPAHIGTAGKGIKSPDSEALPIMHSFHQLMHEKGEMTVLRELLPDNILRDALRAYARERYYRWRNSQQKE